MQGLQQHRQGQRGIPTNSTGSRMVTWRRNHRDTLWWISTLPSNLFSRQD